jgi:hypothetical protein
MPRCGVALARHASMTEVSTEGAGVLAATDSAGSALSRGALEPGVETVASLLGLGDPDVLQAVTTSAASATCAIEGAKCPRILIIHAW